MMSDDPEDALVQSESVDVNNEGKENVFVCETTGDSGVCAFDSCSTACALPDCQVSPTRSAENFEKPTVSGGTENDIDSFPSSPSSMSPDSNYLTDNCTECYCPSTVHDKIEKSEGCRTKDANICHTTSGPDLLSKSIVGVPSSKDTIESKFSTIHSVLASSSVSLNEQNVASIYNSESISKSSYSKSAENISVLQETINKHDKTSSNDEILTCYTNQKNKVSAIQKIPEQIQNNANTNYARLPKELISQDLGSIVKNVHGIFSTVSGSLKNAYNTQRMSMHKAPVKNVTKPIPNGKVMSYIFEEEPVENAAQQTLNEKSGSQELLQNTDCEVKIDAENNESDVDSKIDILKMQVEMLEKLLAEQRKTNAALTDRVKEQLDELQEKDQTFKNFETKLDLMSKRVEQAEREKDAAVMRYASVECTNIEAKRATDKVVAAERAALAEVELLNNKLKSAHGEKQRICQLYDDKCHELSNSEREVSKVREELRELEGRLKWTQSKLRMEMDAYKDSAEKAEKLSQQVSELEAARDAAANSAEDSAKAKQLESDVKESQAALILCRHEKAEVEKRLSSCSRQLETCTRERDSASSALVAAKAEVEQLKISNLRLEEEAAELAALRAQAALADTLGAQLHRSVACCQVERLETSNRRLEEEAAEQAALADTLGAQLHRSVACCQVERLETSNRRLEEEAAEQAALADTLGAQLHRSVACCQVERLETSNRRLEEEAAEQAALADTLGAQLHRSVACCQVERLETSNRRLEEEAAEQAALADTLGAQLHRSVACCQVERLETSNRRLEEEAAEQAALADTLGAQLHRSVACCQVERLETSNRRLEEEAAEQAALADTLGAQLHRSVACCQVERLETSNRRLEEEAAEQAALADTLGAQLHRESERSARAEAALGEARALAETCARREAAALEHAARLTAAHVTRSHDAHAARDQVQALKADNTSLRERVTALEQECTKLTGALAEETDRRNKENKVLARKVAELTEELADSNKKLEWEKGENCVLKKKHASAIKEMNRELQRALKRSEQLEARLPQPDAASTRTGSVTSLSSSESTPQEERLQNGHSDAMPDIQVREPDRQALIERIVSLQRAAARRAERCDFLEEHCRQLTGELRGKARLLRQLLCSLPAGAVCSGDRDAHKKEIARLGGGAMAAVWGGDPAGMTLELSLEMNNRLQAVLEDALLKNITLKENMDTLGAEISRLKNNQRTDEPGKSN